MITKNIYGYMHGGSSFSILDTLAGVTAREQIGDAMTTNASINYFKPILVEELENFEKTMDILQQSKSSITMFGKLTKDGEIYVSGTFTFVKIKK